MFPSFKSRKTMEQAKSTIAPTATSHPNKRMKRDSDADDRVDRVSKQASALSIDDNGTVPRKVKRQKKPVEETVEGEPEKPRGSRKAKTPSDQVAETSEDPTTTLDDKKRTFKIESVLVNGESIDNINLVNSKGEPLKFENKGKYNNKTPRAAATKAAGKVFRTLEKGGKASDDNKVHVYIREVLSGGSSNEKKPYGYEATRTKIDQKDVVFKIRNKTEGADQSGGSSEDRSIPFNYSTKVISLRPKSISKEAVDDDKAREAPEAPEAQEVQEVKETKDAKEPAKIKQKRKDHKQARQDNVA